ncbi:hypothetical protein GCM10020331_044840 [Ectobacillus funiculus]
MIVGEHTRENDLTVNVVKSKTSDKHSFSEQRSNNNNEKKPRIMTLEESLEYLNDDEYCEITPQSIRLRKKTS